MTLSRTTVRALAASVVFVAAGATVAAAAVFHLPVLGFGPAPSAAAASATPVAAVRDAVTPRKVYKTRYVDDVVHAPAATTPPSSSRGYRSAPGATAAAPTAAPVTGATAPAPSTSTTGAPTPKAPTTTQAPVSTTTPPTTTPPDDGGYDGGHGGHEGGDDVVVGQ